jgi:hypothetical protein
MQMGADGNYVRRVREQPEGDGTWTVRTVKHGTVATLPGTRDPISHRGQSVPQGQTQRDAHDLAEEINWS